MKRWIFLGLGALLILLSITVYFVFSPSPERSKLPVVSNLPISEDLKKILYYGSLAPSSHNAQMWKVGIRSGNELVIFHDQSRLLPEVDPQLREAYLSIGAFVENIVQAAQSLGYEAQVHLASKSSTKEIVRIQFSPLKSVQTSPSSALEAIELRHTMKEAFQTAALSEKDLKTLESISPERMGYFPRNTELGQYLMQGTIDAMAKQVVDNGKQEEMAEWTRISTSEAEDKKDGVTPEMMGIAGIKKVFLKIFFNKDSLISDSYRKQTVAATRRQAEGAAGYLVITSRDTSRSELIETGRLYERILLAATSQRIAVHTMSYLLEESPWNEEIAARLSLPGMPQFILRLGYVKDYGKPTSLRRPIDEFTFMLD
ncbi:nitroreductase [Paenibacillus sp. CAA11]|uniref:Acg family FMN-binding oxidoreductase n=1 Tax=Paenibacillus sp. CAA11 TaxID=1532905 RepID=UPI000D388612|nr:nitroreductase [Paenibacillus sp. CAA11]AWB43790.1 nitroreductase [Paenibacillus sp. CAA11]